MSSFFGGNNGFLPPRKRSNGLGSPIQDVVATTAPQARDARPLADLRAPQGPSVADQVAFQRSQLAKGASGDPYGSKNMVTVQSYAPPPNAPAVTRPFALPNENPLIRQFAEQTATTREQEIQKVLARDAGIAIPADALAKVIPITRAMNGLGRLGRLGQTPPGMLREVADYLKETADGYVGIVRSKAIIDPAKQPATDTESTARIYVNYVAGGIDSDQTEALKALSVLAAALPVTGKKLTAADADALFGYVVAGITNSYLARQAIAKATTAAGFTVNNPPTLADSNTLAIRGKQGLIALRFYANAVRPFPATTDLRSRERTILGYAQRVSDGLSPTDAGSIEILNKLVAAALDTKVALPAVEVDGLQLALRKAIDTEKLARDARVAARTAAPAPTPTPAPAPAPSPAPAPAPAPEPASKTKDTAVPEADFIREILPEMTPDQFGAVFAGVSNGIGFSLVLKGEEKARAFSSGVSALLKEAVEKERMERLDRFTAGLKKLTLDQLKQLIRVMTATATEKDRKLVSEGVIPSGIALRPFQQEINEITRGRLFASIPELPIDEFGMWYAGLASGDLAKKDPELAVAIDAEYARRYENVKSSLANQPDSLIDLVVSVLDTQTPQAVEWSPGVKVVLTHVAAIPFQKLYREEKARRDAAKAAAAAAAEAAAAAAAAAAQKQAEADAAAEAARTAAEAAAAKQKQDEADAAAAAAAAAAQKAAEEAAAAEQTGGGDQPAIRRITTGDSAQPAKSNVLPILLAVGAVVGVVYFVSKRQQTLSAAPLLLESFD
jgi:regulator of protease activity HflC (stomatin/prohibitin superfamily)